MISVHTCVQGHKRLDDDATGW